MEISKTRYIIMRNQRTEVLCGCKGRYLFHAVSDIGNRKIKTYKTRPKGTPYVDGVWGHPKDYEVVQVTETIRIPD